jgi:hypothetical protein
MLETQGSDLYAFDDYDLTDPTQLRALVAEVESFLGAKSGVRVSILTANEWRRALYRSLPPAVRRGAERHIHVIRDRDDPFHLLASPSAVLGISEGSRVIYAELVFQILRCIPSELGATLRCGLDDLLAEAIGHRLGIELYARSFPEESALVGDLLQILSSEYGHTPLEWALLMRKRPERVFLALSRSRFGRRWLREAEQDLLLAPLLASNGREALSRLLGAPSLQVGDPVFRFTARLARSYLTQQREAKEVSA